MVTQMVLQQQRLRTKLVLVVDDVNHSDTPTAPQ